MVVDRLKAAIPISTVIGESLELKRVGRELVALCPFHGEGTPSFTVRDDRRFFHCFGCGAHGDMFDWLARTRDMSLAEAVSFLGGAEGSDDRPAPQLITPAARPSEPKVTMDLARRAWMESIAPSGTLAEIYLRSRGLFCPAGAPLRFHPACPRGRERLPAMVALMTERATGAPCGIHRTYLKPDGAGKAPGGPTKMMLGQAGVIRLVPDDEVLSGLGLAEGIETALGVMQLAGWAPVWAAGNAGAIAAFPVLPGIESLTVFCDRDDTGVGLTTAQRCVDRWQAVGAEAQIYLPPAGTDWLDALTAPDDAPASPQRAASA